MYLETVANQVSRLMSKERFTHCRGVTRLAGQLAAHYGADAEKAKLAGILHDCVKEFPTEEMKRWLDRAEVQDPIVLDSKKLWHAPAGAEYARTYFRIDDEVYDAIYYHTIGKLKMPLLTKIVFLADAIEVGRDREFAWSAPARKMAFISLDSAVLSVLDQTIVSVIKRNMMIHPNSVLVRNEILKNIQQQKNGG